MKTQTILFFLGIVLLFHACRSGNPEKSTGDANQFKALNQFNWLIGNWANHSDEGNFYENWTRVNDSLFAASSCMTISGDTVFSESVSLTGKGEDLFYIVSVPDQNEGQPVSFKLVSGENGEFVFENKTHDFPQRIIYKNPAPDSLHARIEGLINGKFSMQEFPMKRNFK